jgi:hypothetical protein
VLLKHFARAALAALLGHTVVVVAFARRAKYDLSLFALFVRGAVCALAQSFRLIVERHDLRLLLDGGFHPFSQRHCFLSIETDLCLPRHHQLQQLPDAKMRPAGGIPSPPVGR